MITLLDAASRPSSRSGNSDRQPIQAGMGTDLYAKCFYRTSRETLSPFKHFKLKTTDSETVHNKKSSSYHVTLLSRPSTGTSSAKLSELPDMHGLTDSQLSELQGAVRALDDFLLFCLDDLRNNRWIHPNTKHVADCLVRGLVRNVARRFQVRPITDTKTRDYRTKLLTRRVRAIMRAFNKNPNYLSVTPNITWDDSFIPPELYDDLETELASLDAKESQRVQKEKEREKEKAKESQKRKMEEQMAKEKAKAKQNDKGKAKETAQDEDDTEKPKRKWTRKSSESSLFDVIRDNGIPADETEPPEATQDDKAKAKETAQDKEIPDDTENLKRKWTRKTSESSITGGNEDGTPADEAEPPAKRIKSKKTVDDIAVPPPCRQCTMSEIECEPNGWCAACKSCRRKKQTCSLSKARCRPTNSKVIEPDDRSSIDSEDEDVVDVVMVNLSATTINGFISDDPKCEHCEQFRRECIRRETQHHDTRCEQCIKDRKGCKYLSKIIKSKPPPKASRSAMEEGSSESSSSSSRNVDLQRIQQQLKVSQEELRIAQQQLRLANSRTIEAQQNLYEAQRNLYEAQLAGYRLQVRGQGSGKAKERT